MKKCPNKITDILGKNLRWPKKGSRLLRKSHDWSLGVEFVSNPITKHVRLWDGYLAAGSGLIQLCLTKGYEHERHSVIYPILFNDRHGLELALKWVILMYGKEGANGVRADHNLWKLCHEIIEDTRNCDKEVDNAVELLIKDFHAHALKRSSNIIAN